MNNLKKYSADLERTLITTPLIRRNKNGTVVLQESILKSRIKKLETLIEKNLNELAEVKGKVKELFEGLGLQEDYDTYDSDDKGHTYRFYEATQEESCYISIDGNIKLIDELKELSSDE